MYQVQGVWNDAISGIQKLLLQAKPQTSTPHLTSIVALYTCDAEGSLRFSDIIGVLQLDFDRSFKNRFLRIYDLQTLCLSFEVELYYGFADNYRMEKNNFYIFDYPRGIIGFLFRSKEQAESMKAKITMNSPTMKQFNEIRAKNLQQAKKKQQKNSFFGKVKNFFSDEPEQVKKSSEVIKVCQQKSIKFDLNSGQLVMSNVPPIWNEMLTNMNVSEKDLENDKDMGRFIVQNTLLYKAKMQAEKDQNFELQKKVKQVEDQEKQYHEDCRKSKMMNLPPPPPLPAIFGSQNQRASVKPQANNLLEQIRNNNVKLKHVETNKQQMGLDLSEFNRDERQDFSKYMQEKLRMRNKALNRRKDSSDDD